MSEAVNEAKAASELLPLTESEKHAALVELELYDRARSDWFAARARIEGALLRVRRWAVVRLRVADDARARLVMRGGIPAGILIDDGGVSAEESIAAVEGLQGPE